jgi:hypothetical protein
MKRVVVSNIPFLLSFLVLFSFAGPFTKAATAEVKTIKIGLITSMTGPMAPPFKPMFDAAKPTEDLMNNRGGITIHDQNVHTEYYGGYTAGRRS